MNYLQTLDDQITAMIKGFIQLLPQLIIAAVIIVLTWALAKLAVRLAVRAMAHTPLRLDLRQLIQTLTRLAVWIVGLMIAMTVAIPSLTPAGLFAGLGVGALAIGFAFQDIFENFLAGVLIMMREKMHIGDSIECNSIQGQVEKITLRETHIRQASGELTIVPNSMLFKNPVKILTDRDVRRTEIMVGVSYDADLAQVREIIRGAVRATEHVDLSKPIDVFPVQFSASSIDFQVLWWADAKASDLRGIKGGVMEAIKQALDAARIEIPYPHVTNVFREDTPLVTARPEKEPASV